MAPDVIDVGAGSTVGKNHHANTRLRIVSNKRAIAACAAVMEDDHLSVTPVDKPSKRRFSAIEHAARFHHRCHCGCERRFDVPKIRGQQRQ
jgi:hypothetical protein